MSEPIKKSVLCDLVTRHSDFDFDRFLAETPSEDYDHWNGFCLPMDYGDAELEYHAIRNSCALFDASPMKKYRFRGKDAGAFLDRILTTPVSALPDMKGGYGLLCNEDGYLLDDGITLKFSGEDYLLLISEIEMDEHFAQYHDFSDLTISEETPLTAGVALQGPRSCEVLSQMGFDGVEALAPFELRHWTISGHEILVGRLGFTGDLGYEVWFATEATDVVTRALEGVEAKLGLQIPGYGLSAVQVARLEAGMIVPGWDTAGEFEDPALERTPYELNLGWNVRLKRDEAFVGKDALKQHKVNGPRFRLKGFVVDSPCFLEDGETLFIKVEGKSEKIGHLNSVAWHTDKKYWIGFASVEAPHAKLESAFILNEGRDLAVQFCKLPFIDLARRQQVPAPLGGSA